MFPFLVYSQFIHIIFKTWIFLTPPYWYQRFATCKLHTDRLPDNPPLHTIYYSCITIMTLSWYIPIVAVILGCTSADMHQSLQVLLSDHHPDVWCEKWWSCHLAVGGDCGRQLPVHAGGAVPGGENWTPSTDARQLDGGHRQPGMVGGGISPVSPEYAAHRCGGAGGGRLKVFTL